MGKNGGRKGKYGDSVGNAGNYGAGCEIPRLAQQDGQTSEILAPLTSQRHDAIIALSQQGVILWNQRKNERLSI